MTAAREFSDAEVRGLRFSSERREPVSTRKRFFGLGALVAIPVALLVGFFGGPFLVAVGVIGSAFLLPLLVEHYRKDA